MAYRSTENCEGVSCSAWRSWIADADAAPKTDILGEQLISEPVEAWDFGPVYRDLYDHTKFFGKQPLSREVTPDDSEAARVFGVPGGSRSPAYHAHLYPRERAVVEHVWRRYGRLSGAQLSSMTHQRGTPWFETYTKSGKSAPIDQDLIRRHYDDLTTRAQAAAWPIDN